MKAARQPEHPALKHFTTARASSVALQSFPQQRALRRHRNMLAPTRFLIDALVETHS